MFGKFDYFNSIVQSFFSGWFQGWNIYFFKNQAIVNHQHISFERIANFYADKNKIDKY